MCDWPVLCGGKRREEERESACVCVCESEGEGGRGGRCGKREREKERTVAGVYVRVCLSLCLSPQTLPSFFFLSLSLSPEVCKRPLCSALSLRPVRACVCVCVRAPTQPPIVPPFVTCMLHRSLPVLLGLLELVAFFVCDYLYARALNAHKRQFPELEDCAPTESPDLDTVAVLDSLATTAVEFYDQSRERITGESGTRGARTYTSVDSPLPELPEVPSVPGASHALNPLHAVVVVCGVAAPLAAVLLLLLPGPFGWTAFYVPLWLSYLAITPGLAVVGLYGARAYSLVSYTDLTKTQWISMMWLRLDFMGIMGVMALVGVGAWFVAACMIGVAAYLAHRVMKVEKHLRSIQRDTQLVRDEVDVTRVLKPGSAESKRAMGIQDGYSALSH